MIRNRTVGLILVFFFGAPMPALRGQVSDSLTFNFQDTDIRVVIGALAQAAGLNITYGSLPARTVTLRIQTPIPPSEVRGILESLLTSNGLELVDDGGMLRVSIQVPAAVQAARAPPHSGSTVEKRLFVYRLEHSRADQIVRTLRALFGLAPGATSSDDESPESLSQQLREQGRNPYLSVEPAAPGQAAPTRPGVPAGQSIGLQSTVELVPEPATNSVMILATAADYEIIQGAIQSIDIRPLQVLIEVVIAEVRRDKNEDFSVSVRVPRSPGSKEDVFTLHGISVGDVTAKIVGIGEVGAEVVLRALSSVGNVTVLSRPILLAKNNGEARILVGDQRPFIEISRVQPDAAASRDQVVQYRNVGTQLVIRPTINTEGYVNLSVLQEVSNATNVVQFGAPVINTREAQTELLVRDGRTAVIGGLMSRQKEKTRSGIPLLKDLPLIGILFGSSSYHEFRSELLILITPRIISSDEDMERLSRAYQNQGRELPKALPEFLADSIAPAGRP